jgi:hypothetical protein
MDGKTASGPPSWTGRSRILVTSAMRGRRDRFLKVSRACKTAGNHCISALVPFSTFQEIYSGCCTGVTALASAQGPGGASFDQLTGGHLCEPSPWALLRISMITQRSLGVASLLALLLHWVQPLPTGAREKEYKRCTSYRSSTEPASCRWHRVL